MDSRRWKQVPVGELCEAIYDGPHATPKKIDNGPIFLGISNLAGGRLDLSSTNHLSEEDFVKWTRRVTPKANDIVFSYETRLGEAALLPEGLKCCLGRRMALMRPDLKKVDPKFLLYAYLGPHFQETIRERTVHGSTVDRILLTEFPNYPISVPPLEEQKAIAHILGTLDDKIELNQQMNRTLEAIARALFKSWFIDFDPVRAKLDGRQPAGMDAKTAALFPAEFEDGGAIGKIPKGWTVKRLEDVVDINSRSIRKDYSHRIIEYVDISSVTVGRLEGTTTYMLSEAPSRAKRLVQHGDTIWSGVRPNRKSYLFIHSPLENLVVSTGFIVLSPKSIPPSYLYAWVTTDEFVDYLAFNADGSAYPAVRADRFSDAQILLPSREILDIFEQQVGSMQNRVVYNEHESATLASIRDTLLPKLLSGEIRVKDAEDVIREVA